MLLYEALSVGPGSWHQGLPRSKTEKEGKVHRAPNISPEHLEAAFFELKERFPGSGRRMVCVRPSCA
jgi:hypothetical protein